jgi:Putative peptidoglycan binding domain/AAA domain
LELLAYGLQERKGMIVLLGAPEVGITTILHAYLAQVDQEQIKAIYIADANISFLELLKTICQELGMTVPSTSPSDIMHTLNHGLLEEHDKGHTVVLIFDNAHNFPDEILAKLHLLATLETNSVKLIQLALLGQSRLARRFNWGALRSLKPHIAVWVTLSCPTAGVGLISIHHHVARMATMVTKVLFAGGMPRLFPGVSRAFMGFTALLHWARIAQGKGWRCGQEVLQPLVKHTRGWPVLQRLYRTAFRAAVACREHLMLLKPSQGVPPDRRTPWPSLGMLRVLVGAAGLLLLAGLVWNFLGNPSSEQTADIASPTTQRLLAESGSQDKPGPERSVPTRLATSSEAQVAVMRLRARSGSNTHALTHSRRGEHVRQLQTQLKAAGFDSGPVDGILGPKTRTGLRQLQKAHGLAETGELDAATLKVLGF